MNAEDLCFTPVVELRRLLADRQVSAEELMGALLERIEQINPRLNAIVAVRAQAALDEARSVDRAGTAGKTPIGGIPFTVKDLTETVDLPTTSGSIAFAEHRTGFDAEIVSRLKGAGGILVGKTNTPEFGLRATTENRLFGPTLNPWNLAFNPGGSSGGAASAIAAGISPLSQGSDAGGSIRGPSTCCGIVGMKPTRGRVPGAPASYESWAGFSTDGPMARSVRDVALMLDVMSGPVIGEPYGLAIPDVSFLEACDRRPLRLRLAYSVTPPFSAVQGEFRAAVLRAVSTMEAMGHDVVEAQPPLDGLFDSFMTIVAGNTAAMVSRVDQSRLQDLESTTLAMMLRGQRITAAEYCSAVDHVRTEAARIMQFWQEYDCLLTPTVTHQAFPTGWMIDDLMTWWRAFLQDFDAFMYPFNVTGQPAVTVPCGWTGDEGLPIGLQMVGRYGGETGILALAAAYEEAAPWADRRPVLRTS